MNWKQKLCLWIAIILLLLMGCFFELVRFWYDYSWPELGDYAIMVLLIAAATSGLIATFKNRKRKDGGTEMPTNNQKTILIVALAASSLSFAISFWFYFSTSLRLGGWMLVLCLGGYGLILMCGWQPPSKPLKVKVLIVLLAGMALGLIWFLFAVFAYMLFSGGGWE